MLREPALHLRMNDQSGVVVGSDLLVMDTLRLLLQTLSFGLLIFPHFQVLDPLSQRQSLSDSTT